MQSCLKDPVEVIQQVNEFIGTNRSPELVQNIAEATNFASMREGKKDSTNRLLEKTRNMVKTVELFRLSVVTPLVLANALKMKLGWMMILHGTN